MERVEVADIALDPRAAGANARYTYRSAPGAKVGQARFVPIGNRRALGFVTKVYKANDEELGFPSTTLKELGEEVANLELPPCLVELAEFVSREYLCSLSASLSAATPPGVQDRLVSAWSLTPQESSDFALEPDAEDKLSVAEQETLRTLQDAGGSIAETATVKIPARQLKVLAQLEKRGLVNRQLQIQPFQERRKAKEYYALTADSAQVEKFLQKEGAKKPAQALTLMRLQGAENSLLTISEIKALAGVTETSVKALIAVGLLQNVNPDVSRKPNVPRPNRYQKLAIDAVSESIQLRTTKSFLLFGVTGSGKTEVYLRLAQEALNCGRQVLYLVPEIALATQAISQLRERFGPSVALLHSELSPPDRLATWMRIREGKAPIVLGARSALFAPLSDVGLVVLDEEHEGSYKQESTPRYHAKRVAQELARIHRCPLVLGSATPSIESFQEAEDEKLTLLSLPERAANAQLPTVHIEDLSNGYRLGKPAILSEPLVQELEATLDRGEQAILFLNRRAYAPFVICRDCGHQMLCPRCSVSLSYHRRDAMLRCHHCDFRQRAPETCPNCGGSRLNPFGIGTEKVEESVAELFPKVRLARLDRDIARKKGALEEILASFRSREIDVLVGTQMVAKGLDFPNVTLVGVVAADISLNIPDFRAGERTFQLLSQVAGRAGRGHLPGKVVIQTFNANHIALQTAQTHDYPAFFEALSQERRVAGYPPFVRLVNMVFTGPDLDAVITTSDEAAARIRRALGDRGEVLGPASCPLERLHNRWRRHALLKLPLDMSPETVAEPLAGIQTKGVQVTIDVDPYSLM